jgi:hypothetical protein
MPGDLDSLLEGLGPDSAGPDSIEDQRLRRLLRARLLDEALVETRIDRFVVHEKLGAGGMGVVFAAHDEQLDRRLAIKLVRRHDTAEPHQVEHVSILRTLFDVFGLPPLRHARDSVSGLGHLVRLDRARTDTPARLPAAVGGAVRARLTRDFAAMDPALAQLPIDDEESQNLPAVLHELARQHLLLQPERRAEILARARGIRTWGGVAGVCEGCAGAGCGGAGGRAAAVRGGGPARLGPLVGRTVRFVWGLSSRDQR